MSGKNISQRAYKVKSDSQAVKSHEFSYLIVLGVILPDLDKTLDIQAEWGAAVVWS